LIESAPSVVSMATCRDVVFVNPAETRAKSAVAVGEAGELAVLDEPGGTELVGVPAVVDAQLTSALAPQASSNEPSARRVMISTVPGTPAQSGRSRSSASMMV
jgi:hypothetical protein